MPEWACMVLRFCHEGCGGVRLQVRYFRILYRYLRGQQAAKLLNVPDISITDEVSQLASSLWNAEVPSIEDSRMEMNRDSKSSCSKSNTIRATYRTRSSWSWLSRFATWTDQRQMTSHWRRWMTDFRLMKYPNSPNRFPWIERLDLNGYWWQKKMSGDETVCAP